MRTKSPTHGHGSCELEQPCRNHYFFGKLLDVQHFRMETAYHSYMRHLHNRLVLGCGVVCGLDVKRAKDQEDAVVIMPGFAVDCCGREIIVDRPSCPIPLDIRRGARDTTRAERLVEQKAEAIQKQQSRHPPDDRYVHLVLCYHECASEPAPVLAGECCTQEPCQPSTICERYRWEVRPGCAPPPTDDLEIPDVIREDRLDWRVLAKIITKDGCPGCPDDCCIPLANIRVSESDKEHSCRPDEIDITVRPIAATNRLLFQLLLCLMKEEPYWKAD